jgi:hypothetical protein
LIRWATAMVTVTASGAEMFLTDSGRCCSMYLKEVSESPNLFYILLLVPSFRENDESALQFIKQLPHAPPPTPSLPKILICLHLPFISHSFSIFVLPLPFAILHLCFRITPSFIYFIPSTFHLHFCLVYNRNCCG